MSRDILRDQARRLNLLSEGVEVLTRKLGEIREQIAVESTKLGAALNKLEVPTPIRCTACQKTHAGELKAKRGHGNLCCDFCGKSQREVDKLIAGPTVYICNECIGLCVEIIDEDRGRAAVAEAAPPNEAKS